MDESIRMTTRQNPLRLPEEDTNAEVDPLQPLSSFPLPDQHFRRHRLPSAPAIHAHDPTSISPKAFPAGLRRGSLLSNISGTSGVASIKTGSESSDLRRLAGKTSRPSTSDSHGSGVGNRRDGRDSKGREGVEGVDAVNKETSITGARNDETPGQPVKVDKVKEDQAMARWRNWAVTQGSQPDQESTPQKRKPSSNYIPTLNIPLGRLHSDSSSPTNRQPSSSTSPSPSDSDPSSSALPITPVTSSLPSHKLDSLDLDVYNTDSVRALRDVELAVDETILAKLGRRTQKPKILSTGPRLSPADNPFVSIAPRLGSRRIRPIVLELIHALGHFIDAVWSLTHPGTPCPFAKTDVRATIRDPSPSNWYSKTITTIQEGKRLGHVADPPIERDVIFWEDEVRHALIDVDERVGIYKGAGWAFGTALQRGSYGPVTRDNVLAPDGSGGNLTRLLNDLEEAIWGDGQPRVTDLAYDLPYDFDPYALPDPVELNLVAPTPRPPQASALAAFLSESAGPDESPLPASRTESFGLDLPTVVTTPGSASESNGLTSPPSQMSLKEIGQRRHQEWLASKQVGQAT